MSRVAFLQSATLLFALFSLCGCGIAVPDLKEAWDSDIPAVSDSNGKPVRQSVPGAGQIEFEIKKSVYCELRDAVHTVNLYSQQKPGELPRPALPNDWTALVSLSLEVDESAALNPGLSLNTPMANAISTFGVVNKIPVTTLTPQSFMLGFGATLSSTASRTDKFDPSYTVEQLSKYSTKREPSVCDHPETDPFEAAGINPARSSPLISKAYPRVDSDLGLRNWLLGAVFANDYLPSVVGPPVPTKDQLIAERAALARSGFSASDITTVVASGTDLADIKSLQKLGYSRREIVADLGSGASLSQLEKLKKEGFTSNEITRIAAPKGSSSKQNLSTGSGGQVPDTVSIELKFVIVTNGNIAPTWKLLRVSANTGSAPLFGLGRTRTHDMIITIGPPTQATANTHLAAQIGNAVSNGNRLSQTVP